MRNPGGKLIPYPVPSPRQWRGPAASILRRVARSALAALFLASLSSCGRSEAFTVLKANRLYKDGYVHEAAALYLKAGAGEEPIASYDLANVFSLLGERAPARAMFEAAIAQGAPGIAVRAWYNLGAAFFAERDYEQAAAAFKHGLELRLESDLSGNRASIEAGLSRELSRAYELALKAKADRRDAGVTERSAYGSGRPDGEPQPFSLSRADEKTLFAPGGFDPGSPEDH